MVRWIALWSLIVCSAWSWAGTLTVTSPNNGDFLGLTNQIRFTISEARVQVTVTAVITGPGGSTTITERFNPDVNGRISGDLDVNFGIAQPQGEYTIQVTATEPGNTYLPTTVNVEVDTVAPKVDRISPVSGMFVRGRVVIRATIRESNIESWRVRVNNADIPNNTGTSNSVSVPWDTSPATIFGARSIQLRVKDRAGNEKTETVSVTVDKVRPLITIVFPRADTAIASGTTVNVVIDIGDQFDGSMNGTGVDVVARDMSGRFITRVAQTSFTETAENRYRWTGRIRYRPSLLPRQFRLVVTALDRAGNAATPQEVVLNVR